MLTVPPLGQLPRLLLYLRPEKSNSLPRPPCLLHSYSVPPQQTLDLPPKLAPLLSGQGSCLILGPALIYGLLGAGADPRVLPPFPLWHGSFACTF